ncbi:hypothetical protein ACFOW1_02625 [Parasediminibacterium paludis]|uniref:Addiction module component n=1 Tax=Parasediminibacterium paludis TaxID=908966 RepID=A0ABV8PUF0_9BACT
MTRTLKEEVLQMVASIDDENILSILKTDIEELNQQAKHDWADELSEEEFKELEAQLNEPDTEENCVSWDEYQKLTAKWRK